MGEHHVSHSQNEGGRQEEEEPRVPL
jgi:hypothetical protein